MPTDAPAAPRRTVRTLLRRHRLAVALVGLGIVLGATLLLLLRIAVQRALATALGVPVSITSLSWSPLGGVAAVSGLTLGEGGDQITAKRVVLAGNLLGLARGDLTVERLDVAGAVIPLRVDADGSVAPAVLPIGHETGGGPVSLHIAIRELDLNDTLLPVRYPVGAATRSARLGVTQLSANNLDVQVTPSGLLLALSGRLEGSLDGAPLRGDTQVRITAEDSQIAANLFVAGLSVSRESVSLPAGLGSFSARVDAHATLDVSSREARQLLGLDLRLTQPRVDGPEHTVLSAVQASLPEIRADLARRQLELGPVTIEGPLCGMSLSDAGLILPIPGGSGAAEGGPRWSIASGPITLRGGELRLQRGEVPFVLALESARWDGLHGAQTGAISATARLTNGGTVAMRGSAAAEPPAASLELQLTKAPLPLLTQVLPSLPLTLAAGDADATLRVDYGDGVSRVAGRIEARDLKSAPLESGDPSEVLAAAAATIDVDAVFGATPRFDLTAVTLHYPYVMVRRDRDGTFPFNLHASAAAAAEGSPSPDAPAPAANDALDALRLHRLTVEAGKVEFIDATMDPPYWTVLADMHADAEDVRLAAGTVGRFSLAAKQDELSPTEISGTLTAQGLDGQATLTDILLASLNPYVAPLLGYEITAGTLSATATATSAPPLLQSTTAVVLNRVGVRQTGFDIIADQSGVPLPIALGLISTASGEIHLTLPLTLDTEARSVSMGSVVWQAVRGAVIGALTSPLRLLGRLFGTHGAPHAFAIDPILFPSGQGSLDDAGRARVGEIARILAAHRELLLVLMPQVSPEDVGAVGSAGAALLAEQRNAAVRAAFVSATADPRLDPDRILLVPWTPDVAAEATGRPGVYVELQPRD